MAGGVQAAIAGIVMATDGDIAAVPMPVIVRVIEPGKAMRINETCTTISAISLDLHRKARREIPHDRLQAIQDRTTSMRTRVAMSIVGMTKVAGSKDRKAAGKEVNQAVDPALSRVANQAAGLALSHHRSRVTAIAPREISS